MLMKKACIARKDVADIDLNSMLDIVFILLIFFIVSASFIRESAMDIGASVGSENTDNAGIEIKILENDELWMAGRKVGLQAVELNIVAELAETKAASLLIQAHSLSETKMLVAVMDAAKQVGINNISLVKIPD